MSMTLLPMYSDVKEGLELQNGGGGLGLVGGIVTLIGGDAEFLFEPVRIDQRQSLLIEQRGEEELIVNGVAAPFVSVLRVGDVVRLGSVSPAYEVALKSRVWVGVATAEMAGKVCAICRMPVNNHRVIQCSCGAIVHQDEANAAEGLQCASLCGVCPSCEEKLLEDSDGK